MADHDATDEMLRFGSGLIQRTVHDLAGIAGTLTGALELADSDPSLAAEALEVARDGAAAFGLRLRLLRAAWLPATEPMPVAELRALAAGLPGAARLRIGLDGLLGPVPAGCVRLLLQALTVAAESLPRGGTIDIAGETAGRPTLMVRLGGTGAAWPQGFAALLAQPAQAAAALSSAEPRAMSAAICATLAHHDGAHAQLLLNAGTAVAGGPPPLLLGCR